MASGPTLNEPPKTYEDNGDRGVDKAKAPAATQAFQNYYAKIATMFSGFKDEITGYENAFYGGSADNVKRYVDGVIDKCQNFLNELKTFEPNINEAMAKYESQQSTIYSGLPTGSN